MADIVDPFEVNSGSTAPADGGIVDPFDTSTAKTQPKRDFSWSQAITDIPSETANDASNAWNTVKHGFTDAPEPGAAGALKNMWNTAKGIAALPAIPASLLTGPIHSIAGHIGANASDLMRQGATKLYGEDKVKKAEEATGTPSDPEGSYESAKGGIDKALMALGPGKGPTPPVPPPAPPPADLFGVTRTVGEETGDLEAIRREQAAKRDMLGPAATKQATAFGEQRAQQLPAANEYVTRQLDSAGNGVLAESPHDASEIVQNSVQKEAARSKQDVTDAYDRAKQYGGELHPDAIKDTAVGVREDLNNLTEPVYVDDGTPVAARMLKYLDDRAAKLNIRNDADLASPIPANIAGVNLEGVDQLRKGLSTMRSDALAAYGTNPSDSRASNAIMKAFDERINAAVNDPTRFHGPPEAVQAWNDARALASQRFKTYGNDVVGKKIQAIIGDARLDKDPASLQAVSNAVYGGTGTAPSDLNIAVAKRLQKILGQDSPEWAALRQGYFKKLTTTPEGKVDFSYGRVADNLAEALDGRGKGLSELLFTPAQRDMLREYGNLHRSLQIPATGANWSETSTFVNKALRAVSEKLSGMIGAVIGHAIAPGAHGVGEYAGMQIASKGSALVENAKNARMIKAQMPLVAQRIKQWQQAVRVQQRINNPVTASKRALAATNVSAALGKLGIDHASTMRLLAGPQGPGTSDAKEGYKGPNLGPVQPPYAKGGRVKRYADGGSVRVLPNDYNTKLNDMDELSYRQWVKDNNVPTDPDAKGQQDYDMRGFYQGQQQQNPKAMSAVDPNDNRLHYTDNWKTPSHETFSSASQWAKPDSPSWQGDQLYAPSGRLVYDDTANKDQDNPTPDQLLTVSHRRGGRVKRYADGGSPTADDDVPYTGPNLGPLGRGNYTDNPADTFGPKSDQPVPESPSTLKAQQDQLINGDRKAQLYPAGKDELPTPKGIKRSEMPNGDVFHYNPDKVTNDRLLQASRDSRENDILGLGPFTKNEAVERAKAGEKPVSVVERDPQGTEVRAAAGTDQTAPIQLAAMDKGKSDGNNVAVESPEETIARRKNTTAQLADDARASLASQNSRLPLPDVSEGADPTLDKQQYTDDEYWSKPIAKMPELPSDNFMQRIVKHLAETEFSKGYGASNELAGTGDKPRYQTWPERTVRSGSAAAHDILTGETPLPLPGLRREDYTDKPAPGGWEVQSSPYDPAYERAQDMAGMAGSGGLGGVEAGAGTTLGSAPFLRPALKYNGKIYKAPVGGQHLDAIPPTVYPEFERQAMNGEDISNFNFGFMNHKGQFLNRDAAMDYAVKEGLIDPHAASQGALTSTILSDSSTAGAPLSALEHAQPFYSAVEKTIQGASQQKMHGEQWANWLKNQNGVKPDELQYTGIDKWLREQKGPVTKQQVADYIDKNKVQVNDVVKGAPYEHPDIAKKREEFQQLNDKAEEVERKGGQLDQSEYDRLHALSGELAGHPNPWLSKGVDTKYSSYQLPGGTNYREHLLTLPLKPMSFEDFVKGSHDNGVTDPELIKSRYENYVKNQDKFPDRTKEYKSSHWDEPNILAHARTNDRDVGGVPALHVEELQSDWHQAGRKKGYDSPQTVEESKEWEGLKSKWVEHMNGGRELTEPELDRYQQLYDKEQRTRFGKGVPDAPFKTNWPELAMKRMIQKAAVEGKSRVSWTPGEAQAARYDLSKHIDRLEYNPKTGRLDGWKAGQHPLSKDNVKPEELPNYVGKDVAEKLMQQPDKNLDWHAQEMPGGGSYRIVDKDGKSVGIHGNEFFDEIDAKNRINKENAKSLRGLDLKVGGEGMKGFYDQILPKVVEKLGKQYGVKVKQGTLPGPLGNKMGEPPLDHKVHYFDIPPKMKEDVLKKGFPLFSDSSVGAPISALEHLKDAKGNSYRIEKTTDELGRHHYKVYDTKQPYVPAAMVDLKRGNTKAMYLGTRDDLRRQGLMTALHDHIEKDLGRKLEKDWATTPDGEAFYQKRQGNKQQIERPTQEGKTKPEVNVPKNRAAGGRVLASNIASPTVAQAKAGNYSKDHVNIFGLNLTIENAKGSIRRGVGPDGKPWACKLPDAYGYIKGSEGADGDHLDIYLGPHTKSSKVFVVNQIDKDTKKFDETKTMLGFGSLQQALNCYCDAFSDGKGHERIGSIVATDIKTFKEWVKSNQHHKPFVLKKEAA